MPLFPPDVDLSSLFRWTGSAIAPGNEAINECLALSSNHFNLICSIYLFQAFHLPTIGIPSEMGGCPWHSHLTLSNTKGITHTLDCITMQGKKIDPKGIEIIVSCLERRWVFFPCFLRPALFDGFASVCLQRVLETLEKISTHKSKAYTFLYSLEVCVVIQWKFATLLICVICWAPHFCTVTMLNLALELSFHHDSSPSVR